jgi:hypothetical protein
MRIAVVLLHSKCCSSILSIHYKEEWANIVFGFITFPMTIVRIDLVVFGLYAHLIVSSIFILFLLIIIVIRHGQIYGSPSNFKGDLCYFDRRIYHSTDYGSHAGK